MANVKDVRVKEVKIVLDKERHLRFDLNAFAEIEEAYGSIDEAFKAMEKGSIKALRVLLWAGLVHEDESLTVKQVGSLIGLADLKDLSTKISELLKDSMPAGENVILGNEKHP